MGQLTDRLHNGDYLAAFADGEGCFLIQKVPSSRRKGVYSYTFVFAVTQRDDALWLMEELKDAFGGKFFMDKRRSEHAAGQSNAKPRVNWSVYGQQNIMRLIEHFDKHTPILKLNQYTLWKEAALLYFQHSQGKSAKIPQWVKDRMVEYKRQLSEMKTYCGEKQAIPGRHPRDNQLRLMEPVD